MLEIRNEILKAMKDIREKIVETLQKHIFADGDIWIIYDLKKMYDDLLPLFEQKESKSASLILGKHIIAYNDQQKDSSKRINLSVAKSRVFEEAMEEYRQQPQKEQEIIKALSGEKIEDVKTVTSTEYPVEQEEEKPTDEEIMWDYITFANPFHKWKQQIQRGECPRRPDEVYKEWLRDNPKAFKR
jgi:hypothetical protein